MNDFLMGVCLMSHMCYICGMPEIASRELRNNTRGLLQRVAGGEDIVITVGGQPVAALRPLNHRPRWINGVEFARRLTRYQADSGLRAELRVLSPDTTDDLPL
jgi:prevent-host-death family protein